MVMDVQKPSPSPSLKREGDTIIPPPLVRREMMVPLPFWGGVRGGVDTGTEFKTLP